MKLLSTFRNCFNKPQPMPAARPNISAPVQEIIKSFSEPKRWKVTEYPESSSSPRCYHKFTALDTKTGESFTIKSEGIICAWAGQRRLVFPKYLSGYHLPTWMTENERNVMQEALRNISAKLEDRFTVINDRRLSKAEKQAKVNKDKERQRLIDLYC